MRALVALVGLMRYAALSAALLAVLGTGAAAWQAQAWRYGAQLQQQAAQHAQQLQHIALQASAASAALQAQQRASDSALAARDAAHYQDLTDAKTETDRLRACVRAGTCGVRIITAAAPAPGAGDMPPPGAAAGVGHAAGALDASAAERVFGLRDAVAADAAALAYLQDYARACAAGGVPL